MYETLHGKTIVLAGPAPGPPETEGGRVCMHLLQRSIPRGARATRPTLWKVKELGWSTLKVLGRSARSTYMEYSEVLRCSTFWQNTHLIEVPEVLYATTAGYYF